MTNAAIGERAGLAGLVPAAELLGVLGGGRAEAVELAARLVGQGTYPLSRSHDDLQLAIEVELQAAGVVTKGHVDPARAAELVAVCEVLAVASPPPTPGGPAGPRLVLSAPMNAAVCVEDNERLESFVLDVIRQARRTLVIGGAFWNEAGFKIVDEVIRPAILARKVMTKLYVNLPGPPHDEVLRRRLDDLCSLGGVAIRWFTGRAPTMLHAKFVIRDVTSGYLGTANLTSWGMHGHIEAGVELTAFQCKRFLRFLQQLESAGLFQNHPPELDPGAAKALG